MDRESSKGLKHVQAWVDGNLFHVVDPDLFYCSRVEGMGKGLFRTKDLHPGEIWWAHDLSDSRFVEMVYSWDAFLRLPIRMRVRLQRLCYVDGESRQIVICAEPFSRVNHGNSRIANSESDAHGNSIITQSVPAGNQILIPYHYEAIISIVWKFREFRRMLPKPLIQDETFLFGPVESSAVTKHFLSTK